MKRGSRNVLAVVPAAGAVVLAAEAADGRMFPLPERIDLSDPAAAAEAMARVPPAAFFGGASLGGVAAGRSAASAARA